MCIRDSPDGLFVLPDTRLTRLVALAPGQGAAVLDAPRADWPDPLALRLGGPSRSIAGRVLDADGEPVAGAKVFPTDPTVLSFGRSAGEGHLDVRHTRSRPGEERVLPEVVECTLAGHPDEFWSYVRSDALGRFELPGLLDRAYTLAALDPATLQRAQTGPVRPGDPGVTLTLRTDELREELRGRVLDPDGGPVAGVRIVPWREGFQVRHGGVAHTTNVQSRTPAVSDAEGAFRLRGLPRSGVHLRLEADHVLPAEYGPDGDLDDPDAGSLVLTVSLRADLSVSLRTPAEADRFALLAEDGERLPLHRIRGGRRTTLAFAPLRDGRSERLAADARATELVLLLGEEEVRRVPLALVAGETHHLEP